MKTKAAYLLKRAVICILLCVTLFTSSLPVMAAEINPNGIKTYISEVKLANSKDSSKKGQTAAKKELTDAGYTVIPYDLNSGTSEGWAYLGYKTTTDPDEAITDLRVMDMKGAYTFNDKTKVLQNYYDKTTQMTKYIKTMAAAFAENVQLGSPAALEAKKILDKITDPENGNQSLGEYFMVNTGDAKWDAARTTYINRFMLEADPNITFTIYSLLMLGTLDYDPAYVPALEGEITEENETETIEQETEESVNDSDWEIITDAEESSDEITVVSEDENAAETTAEVSEEQAEDQITEEDLQETDTEETVDEEAEDSAEMEDMDEETQTDDTAEEDAQEEEFQEEENEDPMDIPYSWLYRFSQLTPASVEERKDLDDKASELLPIVQMEAEDLQNALQTAEESRSEEQLLAVASYEILNQYKYDGKKIGDYLYNNSALSSESLYPLAMALTNAQEAAAMIVGLPTLTVNIQNTAEARAESAASVENQLAGFEDVSLWTGRVEEMYSDDVAFTSSVMQRQKLNNYDPKEYEKIFSYHHDEIEAKIQFANKLFGIASIAVFGVAEIVHGAAIFFGASVLASHMATICSWATPVGILIEVALAVAIIIAYFIEQYKYYHPTYTKMPKVIYDLKSDSYEPTYARYDLVTDPSGKEADLNTFQGSKWLAVYASKDEAAGAPIEADFLVQHGTATNPEGYSPLRLFNESVPYNTNQFSYSDSCKGIYVFFHRDGENADSTEKKYIESIMVASSDDEETARLVIAQKEGYYLFNSDLTNGNSTGTYTYIGYRTTDNKAEAVRDIRVAYPGCYNSLIGDASYVRAGSIGDIDMIYTKGTNAGTPILSGSDHLFVARTQSTEVPEGAEPVNLLSGGPAFDLTIYNGFDNGIHPGKYENSDAHAYLYFMPEETYTSGTEYLGGLIMISETPQVTSFSPMKYYMDYMFAILGYERCGITIKKNMEVGCWKTYNPYRAIRGFSLYHCESGGSKLNAGITKTHYKSTGASVQLNYSSVPKITVKSEIGLYESFLNQVSLECRFSNSYAGSNGLYFTAATDLLQAIKMDEWYLTEESREDLGLDPAEYAGAERLLHDYGKPADLRSGITDSKPLYMYYKDTVKAHASKYVSAISLGYSNTSKEDAIQKLLSAGYIPVDYVAGCVSDSDNSYKYLAIGVQMTNKVKEALTDIRLVYVPKSSSISENEKRVFGYQKGKAVTAKYDLVATDLKNPVPVYKTKNGAYYLYTSKNVNLGEPISDLTFTNKMKLDGSELVQAFDTTSSFENDANAAEGPYNYFKAQRKADAALYEDFSSYLYITRKDPNSYIYDVDAYTGYFSWLSDNDTNSFIKKGMWQLIKKDMNSDAGGRYEYMTYSRGYDNYLAIRDFKVVTKGKSSKPASTITVEKNNTQITYYLACGGKDFNDGAGGDYVYLYYTRDAEAGDPIRDIQIITQSKKATQPYKGTYDGEEQTYEAVTYKNNNSIADFNKGAGGDYVYMYVLR